MVLRAIVATVRLSLFLASFVSFILARLLVPGGYWGIDGSQSGTDLFKTFGLSFLVAFGLFLLFLGLWSFRIESNVRKLFLARLLLARLVLTIILGGAIVALITMALFPAIATALTYVGPVAALGGMLATFLAPKKVQDPMAERRLP